jgi:hypothetical protein
MVLSQLCGKVILNVSFLDKHDGSSLCRLREKCSSGAKRTKLEARKERPATSIRSSVRPNVVQAVYFARCDGLCVAKDEWGRLRQRGDYI